MFCIFSLQFITFMTMFSKVIIFLLLLVMVAAITAVRNDDFENLRDQPDKKFLGRFLILQLTPLFLKL